MYVLKFTFFKSQLCGSLKYNLTDFYPLYLDYASVWWIQAIRRCHYPKIQVAMLVH